MGDEGVKTLAACLGDGGLPRLEVLGLSFNGIGDDGLKSLTVALAKKTLVIDPPSRDMNTVMPID